MARGSCWWKHRLARSTAQGYGGLGVNGRAGTNLRGGGDGDGDSDGGDDHAEGGSELRYDHDRQLEPLRAPLYFKFNDVVFAHCFRV